MHLPLEVTAYAKINLFLNVLGLRADGYHDLRMVMQSVSLADRLLIEPGDEGIELVCDREELLDDNNLVVRAWRLFFETTGMDPVPLKVTLEKRIPIQAGLGGGSADAAAMLAALNHMLDGAVRQSTLLTMAAQLGSDVPFCLTGGTCIATGRGEVLTPCLPLEPMDMVLLTPRGFGIASAEAYGKLKQQGRYREQPFEGWERVLKTSASAMPDYRHLLFNDFEWAVFPEHPVLSEAKMDLEVMGLAGALLSGSGPTLFGLMDQPDRQWPEIVSRFSEAQWHRHRCRFIQQGVGITGVKTEQSV